jgi:hypothetical protein
VTHSEDGTRASTTSIVYNGDVLNWEPRLLGYLLRERLALVTNLLAESILSAINHGFDWRLEPVVVFRKSGRGVAVLPVNGII